MSLFLVHSGVKGMKWGVRNGPPYPLHSHYDSPKSMLSAMKKFKYSEYSRLQSPEETLRKKSGSCHDQVIFEMQELRRMGYDPKATFVIEHDGSGHGGMTHSYVHYKDSKKKKHIWIENAWTERAGENEYGSAKDIRSAIRSAHKTGEYGNSKKYPQLEFIDFSDQDHDYGESLQEFVDNCFKRRK